MDPKLRNRLYAIACIGLLLGCILLLASYAVDRQTGALIGGLVSLLLSALFNALRTSQNKRDKT